MKKQFLAFFAALFLIMGTAIAQDGAKAPRMTPEERVAAAMDKIEAALKPSDGVRESVKTVLYEYYTAQQKAMQELRASGSASREDMMKIRQELAGKRDEKLKTIFSAEQMAKWTKEVEPSLTPQRGNAEQRQ